jgi:exopolyphosphatase / guanosine-5'-triphosphate,3'-diphosphate pyrophosphatase
MASTRPSRFAGGAIRFYDTITGEALPIRRRMTVRQGTISVTVAYVGHRRRARPWGQRERTPEVYAAVDLGTNNCRLLIARPAPDGFRVIDGYSRIVRLGEGMVEAGRLSEPAMERAIEALRVCAAKIERRNVTRSRCIATEACRRAENCGPFLARVEAETGLSLDIISSREEAELTLAGCLPLLEPDKPYALLFDVGGGSAELVWMRQRRPEPPEILDCVSLPCGVVTLTERMGVREFTPAQYEHAVGEVAAMLQELEDAHNIRRHIADGTAQMLGTAGTVTTIAGVWLGLERYDRSRVDGTFLSLDAVHEVSRRLAGATCAERAAHPCIGAARADLVVAGCAVLQAICRTWPAARLCVADRGVREGILLELVAAGRAAPQVRPALPSA